MTHFSLLAILALGLGSAAARAELIQVETYRYAATYRELLKDLEDQLAERARALCPGAQRVEVTNPAIQLVNGLPGNDLTGYLRLKGGDPGLSFPLYPLARLEAEADCR
jgi:hypothetical protein